MKNVIQHGDEICQDFTLQKLALVKLFSCLLGIFIGILTPKEERKNIFFSALCVLGLILIPTLRNLRISIETNYEDDDFLEEDSITEHIVEE